LLQNASNPLNWSIGIIGWILRKQFDNNVFITTINNTEAISEGATAVYELGQLSLNKFFEID
jgi:hypothetical protein